MYPDYDEGPVSMWGVMLGLLFLVILIAAPTFAVGHFASRGEDAICSYMGEGSVNIRGTVCRSERDGVRSEIAYDNVLTRFCQLFGYNKAQKNYYGAGACVREDGVMLDALDLLAQQGPVE